MNFNFDSLMDTISNLRERGAEYANAAMDKTKDAARLAKLTVSLTGEKDALKKAYIELGKAYYEEHHNDAEGLYAQLVEEVDAGQRAYRRDAGGDRRAQGLVPRERGREL